MRIAVRFIGDQLLLFSFELPLGETPAVVEVHAVSGHLVRPLRSDSCRWTSDYTTGR
jgi:hypothetical protein